MTAVENIDQTHSIFEQPWWLDAAAPGQWDVVEIEEGGGSSLDSRSPYGVVTG